MLAIHPGAILRSGTGLCAVAALVLALPVTAQDFSPPATPGWESLPLQREVLENALRNDTRRTPPKSPRRGPAPSVRPPAASSSPAAAAIVTRYRPSPQVSARVRQRFIGWVRGMSQAEAATLEEDFRTRDYTAIWAQIVRDEGLRPGDVADAMASYWLLNWTIANGRDPGSARTPAVREQVRRVLAGQPGFAGLDDAGRQDMAETLMLNFVVQYGAYNDAAKRGDTAMTRRLADAAVARFRNEVGLDLRRLELGDAGFAATD